MPSAHRDPWAFSTEHYQEVFGTPAFMRLLGISVLMAVGIAGFATILAYPVAYFLAFRAGSRAPLFLTLLLIPFRRQLPAARDGVEADAWP